jgi:hypothetical protein
MNDSAAATQLAVDKSGEENPAQPDSNIIRRFPKRKPVDRTRKERKERWKARRKAALTGGAENLTPVPTLGTPVPATVTAADATDIAGTITPAAALALAGVGVVMNGWFARSLGSSDFAGWLFCAVGVAADCVALVMPSCAAGLWQARQRATSLVGWAIWLMTFVFAVTAGIGFASSNISDVTMARASRITPAVTAAQKALNDVMAARDRECKGGVGKFCREREAAVIERRQALDSATQAVGQTADPQTDAASRIVVWATHRALQPTSNDFAMLRLALLALLPQIGGILLMVGRPTKRATSAAMFDLLPLL